jgi:hypothetical protein
MDTEKFIRAYNESRNGTETFTRHPLVRTFVYSDGVKECAEAGCYWLLDIIATEFPAIMRAHPDENLMTVSVQVRDGQGTILLSGSGDMSQGSRKLPTCALPDGEWAFLMADDEDGLYRLILVSEY